MYKSSWIGAAHTAYLQHRYANIPVYYVLGVGGVVGLLIASVTHPFLGLITGLIIGGTLLTFVGQKVFFILSDVLNTVVITIVALVVMIKSDLNPFFIVFTAFGAWIMLKSFLWFGNNYYRYLEGHMEKEIKHLYKD